MAAAADLLATGHEPADVTLLATVDHEIRQLVRRSVDNELMSAGLYRADAARYGTFPDGQPKYAPEWFMAQAVKTAILEDLYGVLTDLLSCPSTDGASVCIGSRDHAGPCWDGNGHMWEAAS